MSRGLRLLVPPVIPALARRLRPPRPLLHGVADGPEGLPDEGPFASDDWKQMNERRLAALEAGEHRDRFMPRDELPPGQVVTSLVVNLAAREGPCRVLDFGGGTGAIYFQVHPFLTRPERVAWHVVDSPDLAELGRRRLRGEHDLHFHASLDEVGSWDLLHVNTSLQYVMDYPGLLRRLLAPRPRFAVLTRLVAGDVDTWFTTQLLRGRRVPFVVIGIRELLDLAAEQGYELAFKAPATEELLPDVRYTPDIPADKRIPYTMHLVLARAS